MVRLSAITPDAPESVVEDINAVYSKMEKKEFSVFSGPIVDNEGKVQIPEGKVADDKMLNTYTVIAVNPEAPFVDADGNSVTDVAVNTAGADALIQWFLTQETLDLAANYGFKEYGESLFYVKDGAPVYTGEIAPATEETKVIRLSTTTSVKDSGLLGYLLPIFESTYGYTVEVQSAGTGKAISAAKFGNADLILVHAKKPLLKRASPAL